MLEDSKQPAGLKQDVSEQVLSCPICAESFAAKGKRLPKVLPCHHGLCLECLNHLAAKTSGATIKCPTCRNVSKVPIPGGVGSFPNNYIILELLNIVKKHEADEITVRTYSSRKRRALACCNCDNTTTESTCMGCDECDGIWCKECQNIHLQGKVFKSHKLLGLDEYMEKTDSKASVTISTSSHSEPSPRCKKHIEKHIDIHCVDCEEMICYVCLISDHSGHRSVLIHEAAMLKKHKLGETRGEVEARLSSLDTVAISAGRNSVCYERHVAGLEARIRSQEQQLHVLIARKAQAVLNELRERTADSLERLTTEKHRLDGMVGRVRESIEEAKKVERCDFDFEVCRSAPELEETLHALVAEMEQQHGEKPNQAPQLAVLTHLDEMESAVTRLFGIVDVSALSLLLPDVSSCGAVEAALTGILTQLRTAAAPELDDRIHSTVAHVLDGVFSLALSGSAKPKELGETNVCNLLMGLLSCEGVRADPVLAEKTLHTAAALCRFRDDASCSLKANINSLDEAGACTEVIAVLRVHGPTNNQICKPAITMIRHLTAIKANVSRLIEAGAPEALMTALRGRGPSVAEVCEDNLSAIAYLANDAAGRAHLRDYGACEELIAVLRASGTTSAAVCEAIIWAVGRLGLDAAANTRLSDAGACEEILSLLRGYGATSSSVSNACVWAISVFAKDGLNPRLRDAEACEEVINVLRLHGPASVEVCKNCLRALDCLGKYTDSRNRQRDAGVCEEFVAVMRRHGATSASLCDQSLYAISKFRSGDARNRLRQAGFCEELVAALRMHGVTKVPICELGLKIIAAFGNKIDMCSRLMEAGAFEELIAVMREHGAASAAVTKEGAAAIASLAAAGRFFRMRLRDIGACEVLVAALRVHGLTSAAVCEECMHAVSNLILGDAGTDQLCAAGICTEMVALLREHAVSSAPLCATIMDTISNLAKDVETMARLRDAGVCEEVCAVLRVQGPSNALVSLEGMLMINTFIKDLAPSTQLIDAGVCEEVMSALRVHGPTETNVCTEALAAITTLSVRTDSRARLMNAGCCEEVVRILQTHSDDEDIVISCAYIIGLLGGVDLVCHVRLLAAGARELLEELQADPLPEETEDSVAAALESLDSY